MPVVSMLLLRVKRTSLIRSLMSANDPKQTNRHSLTHRLLGVDDVAKKSITRGITESPGLELGVCFVHRSFPRMIF